MQVKSLRQLSLRVLIHGANTGSHSQWNEPEVIFTSVCLAHRVWPLSPNLPILLFKTTRSSFKPANCSFIHSLTKSSPESAPIEVMDSLLMVRGIRTLLRGAVAASSAIFFFSLANMVILSTSLSPCRMWGYMLCGVHWDLRLHQLTKKLCSDGVPLISFLLHLEKEKHRNEWMQSCIMIMSCPRHNPPV